MDHETAKVVFVAFFIGIPTIGGVVYCLAQYQLKMAALMRGQSLDPGASEELAALRAEVRELRAVVAQALIARDDRSSVGGRGECLPAGEKESV